MGGQASREYLLRFEEQQLEIFNLGHFEETFDINGIPESWFFAVEFSSQNSDGADFEKKKKREILQDASHANFVGLVRSNFGACSQLVCQQFKNLVNENIYFKRKQYEKGFQNILNALEHILSSSEILIAAPKIKETGPKIGMTINSALFIDEKIFLSQSLTNNEFVSHQTNRWWVKKEQENEYIEMSEEKDFIETSKNVLEVRKEISPKLFEIVLSDSNNDKDKTCEELLSKYPKNMKQKEEGLYCLKIMKHQNIEKEK